LDDHDAAVNRLKLWGGVVAGLVVIVAGIFAWMAGFARASTVTALEARQRVTEVEVGAHKDAIQFLKSNLSVIQSNVSTISNTTERVEGKVDTLLMFHGAEPRRSLPRRP
jgi:hypothetical protein